MKSTFKPRFSPKVYTKGILDGDRILLSQALTLIESQLDEDQNLAEEILSGVLPLTGKSLRIGISGVPGVGKSTFIEAFGKQLTSMNKKVAVLAIDPSSQRTGGSILGDKTRMEELARDPNAFIRPSATGQSLGGVTSKTRESILLCEAAGFDIVIVETVGVGQSETEVKNMVDFFLLLMLAGAGDELQGIKRGIMEIADAIVINKADGDNLKKAKEAKSNYEQALHLFEPNPSGWTTQVLTCSALERTGLKEIWSLIEKYKEQATAKNDFDLNRSKQNINWMHSHLEYLMSRSLKQNDSIKNIISAQEQKISKSEISPTAAAKYIFRQWLERLKKN